MDKTELLRRTRQFAVRVFKLVERLPRTPAAKVITYQILKSSSSVAANYRAVNRAKSTADFGNKIKVVCEEADETNFWLTFIADLELIDAADPELTFLAKESDEFVAIFTASLRTLRNQESKNQKSKIRQ